MGWLGLEVGLECLGILYCCRFLGFVRLVSWNLCLLLLFGRGACVSSWCKGWDLGFGVVVLWIGLDLV